MQTLKFQRGIGSLGWLVILSIAGFALLCLFRLGPHYMDNRFVVSALKTLATNNPDLGNMSRDEINKQLSTFITINNIRGDAAQSFKIVRQKDRMLINSNYEVRVPLVANVDVVLTFKKQLDSSNPTACCEYLIPDEK